MLDSIEGLIVDLNNAGVPYCHWKSNNILDETLSGYGDLDIIISEKNEEPFGAILSSHGFVHCNQSGYVFNPGNSHYYGIDERTQRLVHLHIYTNFETGGRFYKGLRLPCNGSFRDRSRSVEGLFVPLPLDEAILLALRKLYECSSPTEAYFFAKEYSAVRTELQWLREEDPSQFNLESISERFSELKIDQFFVAPTLTFFNLLLEREKLTVQGLKAGLRLFLRWRKFARHSFLTSELLRVSAILQKIYFKYVAKVSDRTVPKGKIIAIVGPEATGKSTLANAIRDWLHKAFACRITHGGKPEVPMISSMMRAISSLFRSSSREKKGGSSVNSTQSTTSRKLLLSIRAIILAIERYTATSFAHRQARKGVVTIFDRYPTTGPGGMDGPRIATLFANRAPFLFRIMQTLEESIYQAIQPAHHYVRLTVSLGIALKRNEERIKAGNESAEYVRERHTQATRTVFPETELTELSTDSDLETTIAQLKLVVWQAVIH